MGVKARIWDHVTAAEQRTRFAPVAVQPEFIVPDYSWPADEMVANPETLGEYLAITDADAAAGCRARRRQLD